MTLAEQAVPSGRREQNRLLKTTAILDAAETLFGQQGVDKTTLGEVAAAASISRPLIYRYYQNKDVLLEAVVERVIDAWRSALADEASRNTPSTAHTLRLVLLRSLEFARERDLLSELLSRDTRLRLSSFSNVIESGNDMLRSLLADILRQGVSRGEIRDDLQVDDLAHVVSEVFLAYADHLVVGEDVGLGDRRIEAILETILHGIVTSSQ